MNSRIDSYNRSTSYKCGLREEINSQLKSKANLNSKNNGCFDILYSEKDDGEILIDRPREGDNLRLITCVDISTLYKEKRTKAIEMAE